MPNRDDYEAAASRLFPGRDPNTFDHAELAQIAAEADRAEATAATERTNDPRKAPPVSVSSLALEISALTRDGAMTEAQAFEALAKGSRPSEAAIRAEREHLQSQADARAAAAYERSPAGRREAAERILAERAETKRLAEGARALLEPQHGPVDDLSDAEVLDLSGIRPSEATLAAEEDRRLAGDLEANLAAMETPRQQDNDWVSREERKQHERQLAANPEPGRNDQ